MRKIRNVSILTDMSDVGISEVKLRIVNGLRGEFINFEEVTADTFNTVNGCFLLRLLADSCKAGDIFLVVLDPRYSDRPRNSICLETDNNLFFLGPNNGVFTWIIEDFDIKEIIELPLTKENLLYPTFNGKYKFSSAATKLLEGKKIGSLGKKFKKEKLFTEKIEEGMVIHIDNYGNIKVKGERPKFKLGEHLEIRVKGRSYPAKFGSQFFDVSEGELVVYSGSSLCGLPEIAINRGNAASFLELKVGEKVDIIRAN